MFSSDADELIDVTGSALHRTQRALNFSILDVLPVIGPMRMKRKEDQIHADFSSMDSAIYRLIAAREKTLDTAPKDLLTRLIAAKDPDNGAGMNATEVRDEVLTIFMAGHETTAVTMTWVWYLLSQHPAVADKLHAEFDAVLDGRAPTADDLPKLVYARMVIDEAMRLYPPAPGISTRVALKDDEVCGVKVRAGTQVGVAPWVMHRHKKLWDHPERFDPERFAPEKAVSRPRFAYMPFGGGPRICIGNQFALMETQLLLATIAQRFFLRTVPGHRVVPDPAITLRFKHGLRMNLTKRAPS
jgi:cytochrome P450